MIGEPTPLQIALDNGRSLSVSQCDCGHCNNEWYIPNHQDFTPSFCPYCGIKFVRMTEGDLWAPPPSEPC